MILAILSRLCPPPPRAPVAQVEACRDCADYLRSRLVPHHRPDLAAQVASIWRPARHRLRLVDVPGKARPDFSTLPCGTCAAGYPGGRFRVDVFRA